MNQMSYRQLAWTHEKGAAVLRLGVPGGAAIRTVGTRVDKHLALLCFSLFYDDR